jgi:hypothetical protein
LLVVLFVPAVFWAKEKAAARSEEMWGQKEYWLGISKRSKPLLKKVS